MKRLLIAFQFLTVLPVRGVSSVSEEELGRASALFPVVALFEGALLTATASLLLRAFTPGVTSGVLILLMVMLNGGLHLDGLSDTFDALASRTDRDKRLAIMKDGRVGPLGVTATVMAILLKLLALNALAARSTSLLYSALFLTPLLSRWGMVSAAFHGRAARGDGLGSIFIRATGLKELVTALLFTLLIALSGLWVLGRGALLPVLLSLAFFYTLSLLLVWLFSRHFGGMTGDTLGAVNEVGAVMFLLISSSTGGSRLLNGLNL